MSGNQSPSADTDRTAGGVSLNHVGQTVQNIDDAVAWYRDVLGFQVVLSPKTVEFGEGGVAERFEEIVGEFDEVKMAQLRDTGGIGLELFEYPSLSSTNEAWEYRQEANWPHTPGLNHFAITRGDIERLVDRVVATGGEKLIDLKETKPGVKTTYLLDPWANVVEVVSRDFDHMAE